MLEIAIAFAVYLAWSVGVNSLGSVLGVILGSGVLSFRKSVLVGGFFAVLGAWFLSPRIIHTLGEKLVHLNVTGLIVVFVSVAILINIFAYKGVPIFTSYLLLGAVGGFSIATGIAFNKLIYGEILLGLFIAPLASLTLGFLIYSVLRRSLIRKEKGIWGRELLEMKFFIPAFLGLVILSFALGANSIGVVVGILGSALNYNILVTIGTIGMVIGLATWSYKIARTAGIKITDLSPTRGFSAHIAAGLTILTFVMLSFPVSSTQTLVCATIGIGLARGNIDKGIVKTIAMSWIVGLPLAIGLGAFLGWLV